MPNAAAASVAVKEKPKKEKKSKEEEPEEKPKKEVPFHLDQSIPYEERIAKLTSDNIAEVTKMMGAIDEQYMDKEMTKIGEKWDGYHRGGDEVYDMLAGMNPTGDITNMMADRPSDDPDFGKWDEWKPFNPMDMVKPIWPTKSRLNKK